MLAEKCYTTGLHQGHCKKRSQELSLYLLKDTVKDVGYYIIDYENPLKSQHQGQLQPSQMIVTFTNSLVNPFLSFRFLGNQCQFHVLSL